MLRPNLEGILREFTYAQEEEQLRDAKEMCPPENGGRSKGGGIGHLWIEYQEQVKENCKRLGSLPKLVGSHQWGLTRYDNFELLKRSPLTRGKQIVFLVD